MNTLMYVLFQEWRARWWGKHEQTTWFENIKDGEPESIEGPHFSALPDELLVKIFKELPQYDLLHSASPICRKWHNVINGPDFWKTIRIGVMDKVNVEILARLTRNRNTMYLDLTDSLIDIGDDLAIVLKNCPNLESLKLPGYKRFEASHKVPVSHYRSGISSLSLQAIAQYCKNLKHLEIFMCEQLTDQIFQDIVTSCVELEVLKLSFQSTNVTRIGIRSLARNCNRLKKLTLMYIQYEDMKWISTLAQGCPMLEALDIFILGHSTTADEWMEVAKFVNLKVLKFRSIQGFNDECLVHWATYLHVLCSIQFVEYPNMSERTIKSLASLNKLSELKFKLVSNLNSVLLRSIVKHLRRLEVFVLELCQEVTEEDIDYVWKNFKTLRLLEVKDCSPIGEKLLAR